MIPKKSFKSKVKQRASIATRRRIDFDEAKVRREEHSKMSKNTEFHELENAWNYFYVMPPWSDDAKVNFKEVQRHGMLICPEIIGIRACPVCAELKKRIKRGDTEFVDQYKLKSRGLVNAIRKEDIQKRDPSCVKVLGMSTVTFGEFIEFICENEVDISDPSHATLFGIHKKGKGKGTRYSTQFAVKPVDVRAYITDKVMSAAANLDTFRGAQPATQKELMGVIREAADEDDYSYDEFEEKDESESDEIEDEGAVFENDDDDVDESEDVLDVDDSVEEDVSEDTDADFDEALEDSEDVDEEPPPPKKNIKKPSFPPKSAKPGLPIKSRFKRR